MIEYPVRLSTTEPNNPVGVLKIRQDDKGTQKIVARITTNSKPQDLTGLEVAFNMRTSEGNVVIEKAVVKDAKLGIIEYVVSGYATQKAGRNNAYFSFFIEDYEQFSTKDFSYFVTTSVTSEGIRGCDYIWRFEDLLEYVTDLANQSQVQLNKLISDVHVIQKQIDEMFALIASQGVLTADEVRKIMINFLSGEDIEITDTFDFIGKVAGSNVENPHNFYYGGNEWTSLMLPTASWGVGSQNHYGWIEKLDGATVTAGRYGVNVIAQGRAAFNFLAEYKKRYPYIFKSTNTDAENITLLKSKLTSIEPSIYAKGSNSAGNKVSAGAFSNTENTWWLMGSNTTTDIAKMSSVYTTSTQIAYLINAQGIVNINYYAGPATETVASIAILDYAQIKNKIKFNISDFVATKAQHEALKSSYTALKLVVDTHVADTVKHITATERTNWNAKQPAINDTGWVKIPFSAGVASSDAYIRRVGDDVSLRGWLVSPAESYDIWTMSANFRPSMDSPVIIHKDDAGTGRANMHFNADGKMRINLNTNVGARINLGNVRWTI